MLNLEASLFSRCNLWTRAIGRHWGLPADQLEGKPVSGLFL